MNPSRRPTIHTSNSCIISKDSLAHWQFFACLYLPSTHAHHHPLTIYVPSGRAPSSPALPLQSVLDAVGGPLQPPCTSSITCGAFSHLCLSPLFFLFYGPKAKARNAVSCTNHIWYSEHGMYCQFKIILE